MAPSATDQAHQDSAFMLMALQLAAEAAADGEVPVGAVVVKDGVVIGSGRNGPIQNCDPTAHAEILALRAAAKALGNYRLDGCTLYVTLEPCAMCSGAMLHGRIQRVVYAAKDPKTGCAGSVLNVFAQTLLNHHTEVECGVLGNEAVQLLQSFFQGRRMQQRAHFTPLREDALRTPQSCFDGLAGFPWASHYVSDLASLAGLRLHYVDQGRTDSALTYLVLHPIPGWGYSYRDAMAGWLEQGARVLLPDLIGFGRSDKPKRESFHTLDWHVGCLQELLLRLDVHKVVLLAPEDAHPLVQGLMAALPAQIDALLLQPLPLATDPIGYRAGLDAPFPNAGYGAALRAFADKRMRSARIQE